MKSLGHVHSFLTENKEKKMNNCGNRKVKKKRFHEAQKTKQKAYETYYTYHGPLPKEQIKRR